MSGPPYPHPDPVPGSNQIGQFVIGVSPIGDITPFDYWTTIISQCANSSIITTLIGNFAQYLDQTQNFSNLYDYIWNVVSARGYGLDVWGRIVGVQRILNIGVASPHFDFQESGVSGESFGQAPFYSGGVLTTSFALADSAFRTLIYAKALANICNGSIPAINQLLLSLFPSRGNCFVTDNGNMTMTYTFNFALSPVEAAIVSQSNVLPTPVGVLASVIQNF